MAVTISKLISSIALITLILTCNFHESTPEKHAGGGFTTDLIHRDSPLSPSYDPSLSPSQRIANALKRSLHRARHFKERRHSSHSRPQSDIIYSTGSYLMKFSLGTPPLPAVAIADTGSDIIWTQCYPCLECIQQSLPIFDPKNSSTYRKIRCGARRCDSLPETYCSRGGKGRCLYSESYQDGSFTDGELATETFTLQSSRGESAEVSIRKITFGCGFRNGGLFTGRESGIVGLGGGKASLVRQLDRLAKGRFSYCLVSELDESKSSKIRFGKANSGSKRAVTTPLVEREPETFYFLTIDGISVGNQRLQLAAAADPGFEGNVIIDSGTTFTLLPEDFYRELAEAIEGSMDLDRIEDPANQLGLCYLSREEIGVPEITVHFRGGDVKWKKENIFLRTSDETVCLAAQPSEDSVAIYGNLAQVNFLVGYDLVKRTVSFEPTDCGEE